jgi:hypothetical protein
MKLLANITGYNRILYGPYWPQIRVPMIRGALGNSDQALRSTPTR